MHCHHFTLAIAAPRSSHSNFLGWANGHSVWRCGGLVHDVDVRLGKSTPPICCGVCGWLLPIECLRFSVGCLAIWRRRGNLDRHCCSTVWRTAANPHGAIAVRRRSHAARQNYMGRTANHRFSLSEKANETTPPISVMSDVVTPRARMSSWVAGTSSTRNAIEGVAKSSP
jgi:hypothetical protein